MSSETLFPQHRKHFRFLRRQNINLVMAAVQPQGDSDEGRDCRHRRQQREQVAVCRDSPSLPACAVICESALPCSSTGSEERGGEGSGVALDVGGERRSWKG